MGAADAPSVGTADGRPDASGEGPIDVTGRRCVPRPMLGVAAAIGRGEASSPLGRKPPNATTPTTTTAASTSTVQTNATARRPRPPATGVS